MTIIKCSDHPKLAPKEQCGHCGLVAPEFPRCHGCNRPQEDWPQAPEIFLMERGWQQVEPNVWMEPLSRCMGPIPEGTPLGQEWRDKTKNIPPRVAGLVEDAEQRVLAERKWSASESLKKLPKGPQMFRDGFSDAGRQRDKYSEDDRDPQAEAAAHLQKAEDELERLQQIRDSGSHIQLRAQARCVEAVAVRQELNLAIGSTPVISREEPKWTEAQIQDQLPAAERARTAFERSGKKSDLPMNYDSPGAQGKPRMVFATERRLRQETKTVHYEACPVCKRYPASFKS